MRNTNCVLYVSNWCVLSKWLCVHGKYIWNKMLTLMNRMTIFEAYQHSIHMTFFITFYFYILIQLESLHNMNISTKYACQFDVIFVLWFFFTFLPWKFLFKAMTLYERFNHTDVGFNFVSTNLLLECFIKQASNKQLQFLFRKLDELHVDLDRRW